MPLESALEDPPGSSSSTLKGSEEPEERLLQHSEWHLSAPGIGYPILESVAMEAVTLVVSDNKLDRG